MLQERDQYVEVIGPPGGLPRAVAINPLFGALGALGQDLPAPGPTDAELAFEAARKRVFLFGLIGVSLGALFTGGITALAFTRYGKTKSAWAPAIVVGTSSLVLGATALFLFTRRDPPFAATAIAMGARLAA